MLAASPGLLARRGPSLHGCGRCPDRESGPGHLFLANAPAITPPHARHDVVSGKRPRTQSRHNGLLYFSNWGVFFLHCECLPAGLEMVTELVAHLGMQACERTDQINADELQKPSHTLLLAGVFRGGVGVLTRCKMAKSPPGTVPAGINLLITVRSTVAEINQAIADSLS